MKRVRMFAGPNGSGKSTIFRQIQNALRYEYRMGTWVNADEIEHQMIQEGVLDLDDFNIYPSTKIFNKFKSSSSLIKKAADSSLKIDIRLQNNLIVNKSRTSNSYEAALVATFIRAQLLDNGLTFSFETVMSHTSKINVLKEAVALGYKPYLYFICTESPEINVERVRNRVAKGGHPVPESKIVSRYYNSLSLLREAINHTHRTYLFDNTGKEGKLVAEIYKGKILTLKSENIPSWVNKYVLEA